jgi:hypothetical protein
MDIDNRKDTTQGNVRINEILVRVRVTTVSLEKQ